MSALASDSCNVSLADYRACEKGQEHHHVHQYFNDDNNNNSFMLGRESYQKYIESVCDSVYGL